MRSSILIPSTNEIGSLLSIEVTFFDSRRLITIPKVAAVRATVVIVNKIINPKPIYIQCFVTIDFDSLISNTFGILIQHTQK